MAAPLAEGQRADTSSTPAAPRDRQDSVSAPSLHGVRPARRVVKPFQEAAWPTQPRRSVEPAALAGLTPDERRVHTALLDALDRRARLGIDKTGVAGLSYAERKKLQALDLAFINAEIAKMERPFFGASGRRSRTVAAIIAAFALGLMVATAVKDGGIDGADAVLFVGMFFTAVAGLVDWLGFRPQPAERRRIFAALRELALLVDDPAPATTQALRESDHLMDQLAADAHRQQPIGDLLDDLDVNPVSEQTVTQRAPVRT